MLKSHFLGKDNVRKIIFFRFLKIYLFTLEREKAGERERESIKQTPC